MARDSRLRLRDPPPRRRSGRGGDRRGGRPGLPDLERHPRQRPDRGGGVAALSAARERLLEASVVVPHTDADGLAAGAIALRGRGEPADAALLLGRGETPWTAALPPGPPALLDWGVRALDRPALVVDHHVPEAEPRA